jgi:hypothetical protein
VQREGRGLHLLDTGATVDVPALLSNQALAGVNRLDVRGAGDNHLLLSDWPAGLPGGDSLLIQGDAGDVVHLQQAMERLLGSNGTVLVEGISHAVDGNGQINLGNDTYSVHKSVDGLHTILVGSEVVVNLVR